MAVRVVSFRCTLKNKQGGIISTTINRDVITHGVPEPGSIVAIADALQDLQKGERREVCLRADQAYGFYDPKLVITRSRDEFAAYPSLRLGESIVDITGGVRQTYRVVSVSADSVTLDGNHPLAGLDLVFELEATESRAATAEEIAESAPDDGKPLFH